MIFQHLTLRVLSDIGVVSLIAAAAYVAALALYYSKAVTSLAGIRRETERHRVMIANLARATEAAEDANNRKSIFLTEMSHQLRTPLNAIIGYSEMVLEDADTGYDEQQLTDMRRINLAGSHLLSLVADVFDVSKIEAAETELTIRSFDVSGMIENIAATAGNLVVANGNDFAIDVAPDVGVMISDQIRLRQIILNLLSNAGKFTKDGKVTLRALREGDAKGDWIKIIVSDTGIGIPKDALQKLFGNFAQAEISTASKYGGTGLGLAISQGFCRAMGGEIAIESEVGKGSQFIVRLPAEVGSDRKWSAAKAESRAVAA